MPTISADRAPAIGVAALILMGAAGPEGPSGTIEFDPRVEAFESRSACEAALRRRHAAAAGPGAQSEGRTVRALGRDRESNLFYVEELDLGASMQVETFVCRGVRLEHRIDPREAPRS